VQLRPSGGDRLGQQISIEAMRALGAPLTGLPSWPSSGLNATARDRLGRNRTKPGGPDPARQACSVSVEEKNIAWLIAERTWSSR
jgi:hypothetical protein